MIHRSSANPTINLLQWNVIWFFFTDFPPRIIHRHLFPYFFCWLIYNMIFFNFMSYTKFHLWFCGSFKSDYYGEKLFDHFHVSLLDKICCFLKKQRIYLFQKKFFQLLRITTFFIFQKLLFFSKRIYHIFHKEFFLISILKRFIMRFLIEFFS